MTINEIIEANQEIMLFRKLNQDVDYEEYTEKIKQSFEKLKNEIEKVENAELREKIFDLLINYEGVEGNREGYISKYAFRQGTKLGFAYGIVFQLDEI